MTDTLTPTERSRVMGRVRSKNTRPELAVRHLVYGMGFRYRLHDRRLPGTPDLVFLGRKKVIFVHGCFWHRHEGCAMARLPKSRKDFWIPKLTKNQLRDELNIEALIDDGWMIFVVWECEVKNKLKLSRRLHRFLMKERTK